MKKRLFDIFFSLSGIILLLPLFIIISLVLKLSSRGPVFFRQKRVTLNGREFYIYKFRTMKPDRKNLSKITVGRDSRITPIGHLLRKLKLDELPQLFNVFRGDMSFIGPRPEVAEYVNLYTQEEREILKVRPGITDYASIYLSNESEILGRVDNPDAFYREVLIPYKIKLNKIYMKEMGILTDIKIILMTVFKIAGLFHNDDIEDELLRIEGDFNMKNLERKILFSPPDITEREIEEVVDTLRSGWITTGPKTKLFEKKISSYCESAGTVCLNSATAGLEMVLRLFNIGPGDEVITSAYTYTASASIIIHVGATPVMVDVEPGNFNISAKNIEEAITERTKAIIPVDVAGMPVDYDEIFKIIERKKSLFKPLKGSLQESIGRILLLADAAHSIGAKYKGRRSGNIADFTSFSFHAVKNLTTGEGGAVTWKENPDLNNEEIYSGLMLLALHGQNKSALAKSKAGGWKYDIKTPGYKCNMTDINAALGLIQLERYEDLLNKRREIISWYEEDLRDIEELELPIFKDDHREGSMHLYLLRVRGIGEEIRNNIIKDMAEASIPTNVHYIPLPLHTAYKDIGFNIKDYREAYRQYENEITLPLHTLLTREDIKYITSKLRDSLNKRLS